jgi:hypothetical protein
MCCFLFGAESLRVFFFLHFRPKHGRGRAGLSFDFLRALRVLIVGNLVKGALLRGGLVKGWFFNVFVIFIIFVVVFISKVVASNLRFGLYAWSTDNHSVNRLVGLPFREGGE